MGLQDCLNVGSGPLVVCSLLLSSFSLCLWYVVFEYGSISRFKGVFSEVWGCCVGLCCSGDLRGLWGFCTRVGLGGFGACCVFAFVFRFFSVFALLLSFCPFSFLLLLSVAWASAQADINAVFVSMPDSLLPLLTRNDRLDLLDYHKAGMEARVTNLMGGTTTLLERNDTTICLQSLSGELLCRQRRHT